MFAKKVKYTDYNGVVREETLYFNLTQAEWLEMSMSEQGGLEAVLNKLLEEQDNVKLSAFFKEFLLKSYGEKSADGRYFRKKTVDGYPLSDAFEQSGAYNEMYMWLLSGTEAVTEFFNGIVPKENQSGDDRNVRAVEEARAAAIERMEKAKENEMSVL